MHVHSFAARLIFRFRSSTKLDREYGEHDAEKFYQQAKLELIEHLSGATASVKSAQDCFVRNSKQQVDELLRDTTPRRKSVFQ